jgi:hypothetical protein
MKVAVFSDIHDHIWNLQKAIKKVKEGKCGAIIFCGDMCAPFTAGILGEVGIPVYSVWGNADKDHWIMVKKAGENLIATPLAQEFGEVELDGKKISYCHHPRLGQLLAESKYYDAVFHGHTHRTYKKKIGSTLVANPGAICGIVGGRPGPSSFMIYDTKKNSLTTKQIK